MNRTDRTIPEDYKLEACPNPFSSTVNLKASISAKDISNIRIYNVLGKQVRLIRPVDSFANSFEWDGRDNFGNLLSKGIYFAVMDTPQNRLTAKLMFIK